MRWIGGLVLPAEAHPHFPLVNVNLLKPVSLDSFVWKWNGIAAKPDAVYAFHRDFLVIEYKSKAGSGVRPTIKDWMKFVRLEDVLQVVIASLCIAQSQHRYVAAILHYGEFVVLVDPSTLVIAEVINSVQASVLATKSKNGFISSSDLAKIVSMRLGKQGCRMGFNDASLKGVQAHKKWLACS